MSSVFNTLNAINVSDYIEKKNGLSYVSWSFAWQELKKRFPESYYTIYKNDAKLNYHTDGKTCWVETEVTVVWYEKEDAVSGNAFEGAERKELALMEMLPVMDCKNRSIPLECVTSMDVNKAIQRSLTKAIARHGLGLYIYAGEDLPEENFEEKEAREKRNAEIIGEIDAICREKTKGMTAKDKRSFAESNIAKVIGVANYKTVTDTSLLEKLELSLKSA